MKPCNKPFKINLLIILLTLCNLIFCNSSYAQKSNQDSQRLLMDYNWRFALGDQTGADKFSYNDSKWRLLNLPHDWSIEGKYDSTASMGGSGGYLPMGTGWYRRHFQLSDSDLKKIIWIEFDGVYMNSDVWINDHHLGNHPYGYSSFYYDLTSYVKEGENLISVRVDNSQQPNTRWYSGSGIYRNVWLVMTNPLHIAHWGTTVTTPVVSTGTATVDIKTRIQNSNSRTKGLGKGTLQSILVDNKGKEVAQSEKPFSIKPGKISELIQQVEIKFPVLWSIEKPELYELQSSIIQDGKIIDESVTTFGIRSIEYDVNKGFLLNGEHVKMNGVCLHHDGGCVGSAAPVKVWERRLAKLKEMGCNAIRTSHNPPAPEFLDLCDKMGFLVMDEAFDAWKIGKRQYDYHIYFDNCSEEDLKSMLQRDRNHPSVVLWSVGNEVPDQTQKTGSETLKSLIKICHKEDPTRPVTSACDNIVADNGATTLDFLNALDIVGYNYVDRWHERRELYYSIDRHDHPNWKMIGTESTSNSGGIRGEYSLGNDPVVVKPNYNFWMIDAEQLWKFVSVHDYVIGDFMWTGIDYLGESFWPNKNDFFGVLDLCGFPKDGYYFYQSQWTSKPMIHLFPHWNWKGREGQIIPVLCYSNCNSIELFINGKSLGEKRMEFPRQGHSGAWNRYDKPQVFPTTADLHLQWDVPYEPGIIKAVGKKDGKIVCTEEIHTTGKTSAIGLSLDQDTINAGNRIIENIEVEVLDSNGNVVPTADNLITFSIEGEGEIIGVDNGDPKDHDSYKTSQRRAFNGLCFVVVQASGKKGTIKLTAQSDGLKEAIINIDVPEEREISILQ
jgi:beta-galactosidase